MKRRCWLQALALAAVVGTAAVRADAAAPDLYAFGQLPVLHNGRIKPLDTIARNSLLRIRGKQTLKAGGRRISAIEWLMEVLSGTGKADAYKIFVINDPDVLGLIGKRRTRDRYYSFNDIGPALEKILEQRTRAARIEPPQRNRFARAVFDLGNRLDLYQRLRFSFFGREPGDPKKRIARFQDVLGKDLKKFQARMGMGRISRGSEAVVRMEEFFDRYRFLASAGYFRPVPPAAGRSEEDWSTMGEALLEAFRTERVPTAVSSFAAIASAYRTGDAAGFDHAVASHRQALLARVPKAARRAKHEAVFNSLQPFYRGMILYLLAFAAACCSWLFFGKKLRGETLRRAAFYLFAAAFVVQTLGILSRMILQGRPPVTNLYSSAIFVGWTGVLLSLALERINRRGIACAVGSLVGFCSLLVAHHLAMSGDTMEMMQAVLDSNFWLAVHVITIVIGYGATFLAGGFAHVYIFLRLFGRLDKETGTSLNKMVYGVVSFALLFTFIGTVLGGIWADQSWGRFWGWDPKENGALLMLLWQSVILHARAGTLVRERGVMVMAVFGCVITSLSWFGVNMLGVGLHSYGFMDKAFFWLSAFVLSQLVVMLLAAVPTRKRRRSARAA